MIIPPVSSPVELWELSVALLWQGDRLIPLAPSRPGGVDEEGGNGALVECEWEGVASKPSRDLGEVCEVKVLSILE